MRSGVVDTVFANTEEALSLYETPHLSEALDAFASEGVLAVVTRSEKGSVVVEGDRRDRSSRLPDRQARRHDRRGRSLRRRVPRRPGARRRPRTCARLGALAAAEIIQHVGARPEVSLAELARGRGIAI